MHLRNGSIARALAGGAMVMLAMIAVVPAHAGSATHTYDSLGRLTKVTYSNGTVITYTYDAAGNRSTVVTTGAPS
jgi:YD repeat-containing protein